MLSDITYTWLLQEPSPLLSPIGLCHYFYAGTTLFCSECGLLMAPRCSLLWGIALNQGIHFSQKCQGGGAGVTCPSPGGTPQSMDS